MSSKTRINLWVDENAYQRTKVALHAMGSSVSEYISDYLQQNVDMIEAASQAKNPEVLDEHARTKVLAILASELVEFGGFMQTLSESSRKEKEDK